MRGCHDRHARLALRPLDPSLVLFGFSEPDLRPKIRSDEPWSKRMARLPAIVVTHQDYDRLRSLLDKADPDDRTVESLEEELNRATLVHRAELPDDVVAMGCRVAFRNETTGREHEMELVYPHELQSGSDRISILAPAGAALLGLKVGAVIDWPMQGREPLQIRILSIAHPLAA